MHELRHQFIETLKDCESQTLDALAMAVRATDRALEALEAHDVLLAEDVIADDFVIDRAYTQVNRCIVGMIATQAPVAGDLRMVTALLDVIRYVERIGDQSANVAKLVTLSGQEPRRDGELVELVTAMGQTARACAAGAHASFAARTLEGYAPPGCQELTPLGRRVLQRALVVGEDRELRAWAMHMVLAARAFGRIAENGQAIATLVPFVASGGQAELPPILQAI